MVTLDNFYQSKAWIKLYTALRIERTNKDGYIICQYCGKPIIKPYDCIAHHKVYLTEDNVNDAAIALNPDNVTFVHHRCHNLIHEKLGYHRQEVFLVYGSPLAGKTTYVQSVARSSDLILDVDKIWGAICTSSRYEKPNCLASVALGVRDYILDCIRVRRGKWQNAYIIGGYPLVSERERLIKATGARAIYIESTKEECLERLEKDTKRDKAEWKKYIDIWWERYSIPPSSG